MEGVILCKITIDKFFTGIGSFEWLDVDRMESILKEYIFSIMYYIV